MQFGLFYYDLIQVLDYFFFKIFSGAAAKLPGLLDRIRIDLISNRPFKSNSDVTCAQEPTLDAFRGMQKFANDFIDDDSIWITKSEYEEKGGELMKIHSCSN